jgi:hypothetical protein
MLVARHGRLTRGTFLALLLGTAALAAPRSDTNDELIDFSKASTLTPRETADQARTLVGHMTDHHKHISKLVETARKHGDVVKLNCLNDKFTQVQGHLTVTDQSMKALNGAVARNDDGARVHEFTRIVILHQKVSVLRTEAENCIGEDISYVGAGVNEVEIDPNIPTLDPTEPQLPLPDVTRPPEATPFA